MFTDRLTILQFFLGTRLGKALTSLSLMRPPQAHTLPVVLSREEVWRMLHLVRLPVYRVCLITIYACGLRRLEGARLQVSQVDSARGLVHVTGRGQYDRWDQVKELRNPACSPADLLQDLARR